MKYLDGYKAIIAYVERVASVSYSANAMRMIIARDPELNRARTWFAGTPRISTTAIDAWVARMTGRRRKRTRFSA